MLCVEKSVKEFAPFGGDLCPASSVCMYRQCCLGCVIIEGAPAHLGSQIAPVFTNT